MEVTILEANDKIFEFLEETRGLDNQLRYTLRKSNYGGRLEEGYWFYGNENYIAISFWSGMDWKNHTPNICWMLDKYGKTRLEINVSDSELKFEFVKNILAPKLDLKLQGARFYKEYGFSDFYIQDLLNFLSTDKLKIDKLIKIDVNSQLGNQIGDNLISFIAYEEFHTRLEKTQFFKNQLKQFQNQDNFYTNRFAIPGKIQSLTIQNYGSIKNISFHVASPKNQWIFLTGENGSGKTQVLRAIATVLGNIEAKGHLNGVEATLKLFGSDSNFTYIRKNIIIENKNKPLTSGLAVYGPFRLDVSSRLGRISFRKRINGEAQYDSLFKNNSKLLSLDQQLFFWKTGSIEEVKLLEKRIYFIRSILTETIVDLVDLRIEHSKANSIKIKYYFRNEITGHEYSRSWNQLSTGNRSILGMIGDILIRLYDQQRDITDPSELQGVVIIDEIDLHLHPKAQKELVIKLSEIFTSIQFIASTHSPIPLLGAPKQTIFFKMENVEDQISLSELEIDVSNLLPNTILSSPIFGMSDLLPISRNNHKDIRTESTWKEIKLNDEIHEELEKIYFRLRRDEENKSK